MLKASRGSAVENALIHSSLTLFCEQLLLQLRIAIEEIELRG